MLKANAGRVCCMLPPGTEPRRSTEMFLLLKGSISKRQLPLQGQTPQGALLNPAVASRRPPCSAMRVLFSILGVFTLLALVPLGKTKAFHARDVKLEAEERTKYVRNLRYQEKVTGQLEEGGRGRTLNTLLLSWAHGTLLALGKGLRYAFL